MGGVSALNWMDFVHGFPVKLVSCVSLADSMEMKPFKAHYPV